jgi:hypothetical protein
MIAIPIRNKSPAESFNIVEAMEGLGKEFVESAGELAPEEMADNLMPVLTHLLPDADSQRRWLQQMLTRLGMVGGLEAANVTGNATQQAATVAAQIPARPKRAPVLVSPPRTKRLKVDELVEWDEYCMYCSKEDPTVPVCQSTASTNRCRCRNKLKQALEYCGNKARQAVVIHDYCTRVDPPIGQCLGLVEDPSRSKRVAELTARELKEFLHSERMCTGSNDSKTLQLALFKAVVPMAPKVSTCTAAEEKQYQHKMKEIYKELELTPTMKKRAEQASILKRKDHDKPDPKNKVLKPYKRKPPCSKKWSVQLQ